MLVSIVYIGIKIVVTLVLVKVSSKSKQHANFIDFNMDYCSFCNGFEQLCAYFVYAKMNVSFKMTVIGTYENINSHQ